ncbi:MAG: Holliday junction branch migration protein RuvA [Butyribacter sp.]|nr:Holliday junction branch migration protein RuvA [bacterium]MDY3855135.1 Holliday junction branch migration protein RuvA [Butyribacter sp.]
MIRFIKGTLAAVKDGEIVIENKGIGYLVYIPLSAMELLPSIGEELQVFTYFHVREDLMQLYGFLSQDDLQMFELLITVNGIGPKAALGILGAMSAYDVRYAVMADDEKAIAKAPGIGPKTARKLILELKDKVTAEDVIGDFGQNVSDTGSRTAAEKESSVVQDAIEALVVLGYSKSEAVKAVRSVAIQEDMTVEDVLKQSLKAIG